MKRFAYWVPLLVLPLAAACPSDGGGGADTGTSGADDGSGDDSSGPGTMTTMMMTTMPADSSGGEDCTAEDECILDEDCLPGQTCASCICAGTPTGCAMWGEGNYGNCLDPAADCGAGASCVVDNTSQSVFGVCYFTGCTEQCDCPQPPEGFEAQVTCGALVDMEGNCYISCEGDGDECPEDYTCVGETFCALTNPDAIDHDGYGDCNNILGVCPQTVNSMNDGFCLQANAAMDMSTGAGGVCTAGACDDVADCPPAPATGDAPVMCVDAAGTDGNECILSCAGGETCADGMVCHPDFGICYWETAFLDPYGECETGGTCPGAAPNCITNTSDPPTLAVCTNGCGDAMDCPPAPMGGTAPVTCADPGTGSNTCYLDCSAGGGMCPPGMVCLGSVLCANMVP